jgi:hypothetical protein
MDVPSTRAPLTLHSSLPGLLDLPFLQEGLIGAAVGALIGKVFIRRAEQRGDELSPRRVRQLELRWTCVGIALAGIRVLADQLS